jgi:hypothetical protein
VNARPIEFYRTSTRSGFRQSQLVVALRNAISKEHALAGQLNRYFRAAARRKTEMYAPACRNRADRLFALLGKGGEHGGVLFSFR